MNLHLCDVEVSECLFQVHPCSVEGDLVNFEFGMGDLHASAFVIVGTSSDQGDELFLPGHLFGHVCVAEKRSSGFISQHEVIELVNDCTDCCLASESFEEGLLRHCK